MSNIIDSIQLSGTVYTISGGGTTYTAGRGIDITNNTVSLDLPISAGTGTNSIAEGSFTTASGSYGAHAEGHYSEASGNVSHAEGAYTIASGYASHAEGMLTSAFTEDSHTEGFRTFASNLSEHASGQFNISSSDSTTFGDSGNTLFSVGNGTADNARHNAFEIRQNGDIYLTLDGQDVKLQDHLGGGGGGNATVELTQAEYDALVSAGTVSADTYYIITDAEAGDLTNYYTKSEINTLLGGLSLVKLTQAEYDALSTKDSNTLYVIVN